VIHCPEELPIRESQKGGAAFATSKAICKRWIEQRRALNGVKEPLVIVEQS
jgi:hypothetical protein